MLVARQAYENGTWMWLVIGGPHDGHWVDCPVPPMARIRAATPSELEEAKNRFWHQQA